MFNETDGWGFIETEDTDENVFFKMEDVDDPDLKEGQEVEFDIDQSEQLDNEFNIDQPEQLAIKLNINEPSVLAHGVTLGTGL